jgi:hypothetical protein
MSERTDEQAIREQAMHNAAHDAAVHRQAEGAAAHSDVYHDATHPAVTGSGVGDNRDETGDPEKAAALGALGGAAVGAAAGSLLGPAGAVMGAIGGALAAAGASGLAVDAVDQVDNDNTAWMTAPSPFPTMIQTPRAPRLRLSYEYSQKKKSSCITMMQELFCAVNSAAKARPSIASDDEHSRTTIALPRTQSHVLRRRPAAVPYSVEPPAHAHSRQHRRAPRRHQTQRAALG